MRSILWLLGFGISTTALTHKEVCVAADPAAGLDYILSSSRGGVSYKSPNVSDLIDLFNEQFYPKRAFEEPTSVLSSKNFVDLPLVMSGPPARGEVHQRSGLNWGQREGRNPDQAYIPIPSTIAKAKFFFSEECAFSSYYR